MEAVHRQVEALLKPRLHAVRPLRGAVDRIIGDDCVGKIRNGSTNRSEIGVNHQIEDAGIGNLRVVNLNLVGLRIRTRRYHDKRENHNEQASESHYSPEEFLPSLFPWT